METSRRKVILINPKFQISFITQIIYLSVVSITALYGANVWLFYKFSELGKEMGLPSDHIFFQFISAQKTQMNWTFLAVSIVLLALLSIAGAVISHKVAGPIYRLCLHLKEIKDGSKVAPFSFRNDDYFQEIADHLNPVLDKITSEKNKNDKVA
jgi:sensor histidine kinase YesM